MRDDIGKVPLPGAAKRYARMTSKTLGSDWSKKVDMFIDAQAAITNQSKEGYKNRDAGGKVPHAMKEAAERVVEALIYGDSGYQFVTSCVGSTSEKIHAMIDQARDVSKAEFFRNVPLREIFQSGVADIYAWTPRECALAGVPYEDYARNRGGLRFEKDWAISYHKSVYDGMPCYYFDHSRIEYIFCKP